ncbi:hypothetical protein AAF712_004975 [Marasmius tenuissimus]|uniref:Uncharacterized protein n=1 Tax=Marasmius tenuissimus TaxID=585030 RepID=A0ABR3A3Y9_9AGAR
MVCPKCMDEPDCVIFDGVTLAFRKKHLQDSLRPPTFTSKELTVRNHQYPTKPQLVQDSEKRPIRRLMKGWIKGGKGLAVGDGEEELEEDKGDNEDTEPDFGPGGTFGGRVARANQVVCENYEFNCKGPTPTQATLWSTPRTADEYATQMVSPRSLPALRVFVKHLNWVNATKVVEIPALYNVLEGERKFFGEKYPMDLLGVCKWLENWGTEVLMKLSGLHLGELPLSASEGENNWKMTGCYYSLPKVHERPLYPKLRGDGDPEKAIKEAKLSGCCKLYHKYGQKQLTGGIMCAWCTHSICYGFHCIPKAEGRNDVFATLVTRWRKAPHRVVYNFACALASYCMIREPEFFQNTQFLIDQFHEAGHSKCGSACFLSTYVGVDQALGAVNSSAAECGNSGIGRIWKSADEENGCGESWTMKRN